MGGEGSGVERIGRKEKRNEGERLGRREPKRETRGRNVNHYLKVHCVSLLSLSGTGKGSLHKQKFKSIIPVKLCCIFNFENIAQVLLP